MIALSGAATCLHQFVCVYVPVHSMLLSMFWGGDLDWDMLCSSLLAVWC